MNTLEVRQWDGSAWPEKRISIAEKGGRALFINARYNPTDEALPLARDIVRAVSENESLRATNAELLEALEKALMRWYLFLDYVDEPEEMVRKEHDEYNRALAVLGGARPEKPAPTGPVVCRLEEME